MRTLPYHLCLRFCFFAAVAIALFGCWYYQLSFNALIEIVALQETDDDYDILPFFFNRHEKVASVKCARLINGKDKKYVDHLAKHRITLSDDDEPISKNCSAIRSRHLFPLTTASEMERDFPIAFARIIYKDYLIQEMMLSAMYAPQNVFCYVIDAHSPRNFTLLMNALADCFPNVFVLSEQFNVDTFGHNMTRAHLACMAHLLKVPLDWRYLITLHNDDVPLKTNRELVHILTALNGSNDIEVIVPNADRIPPGFDWHYSALRLLRNNRTMKIDYEFKFAKSIDQVSLTRAFVEFLFVQLNLDELMKRLDLSPFGANEIFFPSIDADDHLEAPGGFTRQCLDKGIEIRQITRFTSWDDRSTCASGHFRHWICVFGVEDLIGLQARQELFANKMMAQFDFAAISCQLEELHNRSIRSAGKDVEPYPVDVYAKRTRVRYHKWKNAGGTRSTAAPFDCKA